MPLASRTTDPLLNRRVSTLIDQLSLKEKIGQLFVMAYAGHDLEYAKSLVRDFHIGGFYLSQDNIETTEQAFNLTSTLNAEMHKRTCDAPLLYCIDQEGAWGVMTEETITGPGNLALGAADDTDLTKKMYSVLAREMSAVGLNVILGPCSDINSNPDNTIIGARAFGESTKHVVKHVRAAVEGLRDGGVLSCSKHFPGHGDTSEDSHRLLSTVSKTLSELKKQDLAPFQAAIDIGVNLIMTSHIMYPSIDPNDPATLSNKILTGLLRSKMGFQGIVITDSMNMWAMRKNYRPAEAAVKALKAGVNLIMLSEEHYENSLGSYKSKQKETIEGVIAAVQKGELDEQRIDDALNTVLSMKYSSPMLTEKDCFDISEFRRGPHIAISEKAAQRAIKVLRNENQLWPLRTQEFILIGTSHPSSHETVLQTRGIGPNEPVAAYQVFCQSLKQAGANFTEISFDEINDFMTSEDHRTGKKPIVLVTEDYPIPGIDYDTANQIKIVQGIINIFYERVVVVAFRSDYELTSYSNLSSYICAYSSRAVSAEATAKLLLGS